MYDGPVIDSFLHGPWIGSHEGPLPRADIVPWTDDARLRRVLHTFHHPTDEDGKQPSRSLDDVLADMDRNGVAKAILIAKVYYPSTADRLAVLHDEFAGLAARSNGRIKWVATVVPPELGAGSYWDLMANPRIIEGIKDAPGLVGVHITPSPWGLAPNDRWYYPLYTRCVDLGLALFTYVGTPGPLWPMEPNNPRHLDDVALAFPELRIVAHHIGDPWTDISIRLAARHPNFMICTSAWFPKSYPPELLAFMKGRWHGTPGCERVMFASDYPLLDLDRTITAAREMDLSEEQFRSILHDNAQSWFFS